MGLIPFLPVETRPIIGCGLGAVCIVAFQESEPYHDAATNTLAVAAQWQISLTYFFAFALSTGFFETEDSQEAVGVALVMVNLVIIVTGQ